MNSKCLSFSRCRNAIPGLALALALLSSVSADAQNLVRNPDFEDPLGPDNWTIVYTNVVNGPAAAPSMCGPSDFSLRGRVRVAHKDLVPGTFDGDPYYWSKFGLDFRAGHDWLMHAYARQVISNLTPNVSYVASVWMAFYETDQPGKIQVWMEVLGGPTGSIAKNSGYVTQVVLNNPAGWTRFSVTNSSSTTGRMEIRLHYNKNASTSTEKWRNMDAIYDHVSLIPLAQAGNLYQPQPSYPIVSFARTGQDIALTWQSVMNNSYRLEVSPNISDPGAWSLVQSDPYLDPNIFASGPTTTYVTNVPSMLSYNPSLPANGPLYFRIRGTGFQW